MYPDPENGGVRCDGRPSRGRARRWMREEEAIQTIALRSASWKGILGTGSCFLKDSEGNYRRDQDGNNG